MATFTTPQHPPEQPSDTWLIQVFPTGVHFSRLHEGRTVESYARVGLDKAAIYAAAVIQGFEPPRDLRRLDKPVG